ncbi:TetR/AcrR family transcriptional regulator [Nonomuraea guangzhouensis]|uniref:TetR/AcrR family transcriptional regulator n=1 Tax=Nonomuraea guangzhouensis TaxID=1291555 RepID=A0ABW4GT95_9ACTN|nr:TetR/AcrR family transcriptional regulator [Nonomuraea guangzhouensis]
MNSSGKAAKSPDAGLAPTEQRLMDAARALFATKGYSAVGIREIAREASLTIGSLYHYASSKEDLFLKLMRRNYESATRSAREAATSGSTPAERLANLVRAHVTLEVSDSNVWRLNRSELEVISTEARAELVALRDEFEQIWRQLIEDGVADGSFTPDDPVLARFSIIQMCNGVALWYRPDGRLSLDEIAAVISRQALALLHVA